MQDIFIRQQGQVPEGLKAYPGWMGQLLYTRGIETEEAAQAFLNPSRDQILHSLLLHDMEKARDILLDRLCT